MEFGVSASARLGDQASPGSSSHTQPPGASVEIEFKGEGHFLFILFSNGINTEIFYRFFGETGGAICFT
jgi:hypothetical protein